MADISMLYGVATNDKVVAADHNTLVTAVGNVNTALVNLVTDSIFRKGQTLAAGITTYPTAVYYSVTSNQWEKSIQGSTNVGGVAVAAGTVLLAGYWPGLSGLTVGQQYLSASADGEIDTASSSGLKIGWCPSATEIYVDIENAVYKPTPSSYFAGGNAGSPVRSIDKLTSDTVCGAVSATMSSSRQWLAGATLGSSGYIVGGHTGSAHQNTIDKISSDTVCGAVAATLSSSRSNVGAAVIASSAYFAGGTTGSELNNINKLTNDSTCSSVSATLSNTRYTAAGATIGSSAYFAGGTGPATYNVIDKLTGDSSCSAVAATLTSSRWGVAGATIGSSAYFAGGRDSGGTYLRNINKLTNDSTCSSVSATLSSSRLALGSLVVASSAYFAGGEPSGPNVNTIDKLTGDATCAAITATLSASRSYCAGVAA